MTVQLVHDGSLISFLVLPSLFILSIYSFSLLVLSSLPSFLPSFHPSFLLVPSLFFLSFFLPSFLPSFISFFLIFFYIFFPASFLLSFLPSCFLLAFSLFVRLLLCPIPAPSVLYLPSFHMFSILSPSFVSSFPLSSSLLSTIFISPLIFFDFVVVEYDGT